MLMLLDYVKRVRKFLAFLALYEEWKNLLKCKVFFTVARLRGTMHRTGGFLSTARLESHACT